MSHYIFKGRLCGYICAECPEPLANLQVRLYRVDTQRNVAALAVANPKETFVILDDDQVQGKQSRLLANAETDAEGNFSFEIGENYAGEAFEVDVYCGSVPRQKIGKKPPNPRQFTITTLQPRYRETEHGFIAVWNYCLPNRFWCAVLAWFDVWTICGRVLDCETKVPIGGVRVRAFDVDWLADDTLGLAATTDATGKFIITYSSVDFRQGTWIDVELIGGPDLYFKIETLTGSPLLVEASSRGRAPDRENAGNCFCVELCIDKEKVPPIIPETLSVFNKIGGDNFLTAIDSGAGGDGKTLADERSFYSNLRLNGILSKTKNGNPLEYAFEVAAYDPTTNVLGPYTQVPLAQIAETNIGTWEHYTGDILNPVETKEYILNGVAAPNVLVPQVSPDGWVRVPQESNVFAPQGNFVASTGAYPGFINLISSELRAFGAIDALQVQAGESATTGGTPLGRDYFYSLRMKVRERNPITDVTVPGSEQVAGTCVRLAVMNTLYNNVSKGGTWSPFIASSQLGVASLDIKELREGGGCSEINQTLDVLYTAAQPNLGQVRIAMTGPGGPYGFSPAAPVSPNRFGSATPGFVFANLQPCAYIVKLEVELLLTTGDGYPDFLRDEVAFCKA